MRAEIVKRLNLHSKICHPNPLSVLKSSNDRWSGQSICLIVLGRSKLTFSYISRGIVIILVFKRNCTFCLAIPRSHVTRMLLVSQVILDAFHFLDNFGSIMWKKCSSAGYASTSISITLLLNYLYYPPIFSWSFLSRLSWRLCPVLPNIAILKANQMLGTSRMMIETSCM